jgi:hypothetical protein
MFIEFSLIANPILRYISFRDVRRLVMEGRRQSAPAAIELLGRVSRISIRLKQKHFSRMQRWSAERTKLSLL